LHRLVLAIALPLFLAACDQSPAPTPSTTQQPASPAPSTPAPQPSSGSTGAAATDPLIGSWAASPANCAAPIVIAADSFQGAENSCTISGWTDNGDGSSTAAMSCQSEGQATSERIKMEPLFGPQGEGIRLSYLDRGGDPVTVFSCPTPRTQ